MDILISGGTMSDLIDPRAQKVQTIAHIAGTGVIAAAASAAVVVVGSSVVAACAIAVAALFSVQYILPVAARSIALWRQKSLTALAETFSEETIREDERREAERIKLREEQYITLRAEIEGAIEELQKQRQGAGEEEEHLINSQLTSLRTTIEEEEQALRTEKENLNELLRVNKLYIALHRSATAMTKAQGAKRGAEEIQRVETARTAIKTKMRAAMAGRSVESMNRTIKNEIPTLPTKAKV
jgi:hypothetical protein